MCRGENRSHRGELRGDRQVILIIQGLLLHTHTHHTRREKRQCVVVKTVRTEETEEIVK